MRNVRAATDQALKSVSTAQNIACCQGLPSRTTQQQQVQGRYAVRPKQGPQRLNKAGPWLNTLTLPCCAGSCGVLLMSLMQLIFRKALAVGRVSGSKLNKRKITAWTIRGSAHHAGVSGASNLHRSIDCSPSPALAPQSLLPQTAQSPQ